MGIFNKILRNMPGSPKSVAKLQYDIYSRYRSKYPDWSAKKIFHTMLGERYAILKTVKAEEFDAIVANCDNLVEFTLSIIARENPPAMSEEHLENTLDDIMTWFRVNAKEEYDNFTFKHSKLEKEKNVDAMSRFDLEGRLASLIDGCDMRMLTSKDASIIMYRDNTFAWGIVDPEAENESNHILSIIPVNCVEPEYGRLLDLRKMDLSTKDPLVYMATDFYAKHALALLLPEA